MASSISTNKGTKKVDMSESAMAAYRRRIATNNYPLPSDPSVGISKDSSLSSAVLASQADLMPKLWYPSDSPTARKASVLANKADNSPKIWQPTLSADAATAALKSKENTKVPHYEPPPLSKSASKAALQAAETPGEVYGAKYLKEGYEFTAKSKEPIGEWAHLAATRINSVQLSKSDEQLAEQSSAAALKMGGTNEQLERMDIVKIESMARERARQTLSNVYLDLSRDRMAFKGANGAIPDPATSEDPRMLDYIGEQQYWQRQDVLSLVSIADRNAKAQIARINKDVSDMNVGGSLEAQRKAYALASENHTKRTVHLGKVNVGGGLYMTQEEIDDIARRNVQPTLVEVTEVAAERREADRIEAERLAEERRVKEEERKAAEDERRKVHEAKEKERREAHEARMLANEKLRKERAQVREEKRLQKDEARRIRAEEKAQAAQAAQQLRLEKKAEADARAAQAREARLGRSAAGATAAAVTGAAAGAATGVARGASSAGNAMSNVANPVSNAATANLSGPGAAPGTSAPATATPAAATTAADISAAAPAQTAPVTSTATSTSPPTQTVSGAQQKRSQTSRSSTMFRKWFGTAVTGVAASGAAAGAAVGGMSVKPQSLQDNGPLHKEAREKILPPGSSVDEEARLADYKLEARRLKIDRQSFEQAAENASDERSEATKLVESLEAKLAEADAERKPELEKELAEATAKAEEATAKDDTAHEAMLAAVTRHREAKARYHDLNKLLKASAAAAAVQVGDSAPASPVMKDIAEPTDVEATAPAAMEAAAADAAPEAAAVEAAAASEVAPEVAPEAAAEAAPEAAGDAPPVDTKLGIDLVGEKLELKGDKFAGFESSNVESGEGIFKEDI